MAPKQKVSIPELFKLWHTNVTSKVICEQLGISDSYLRRLIKLHGLPRRPRADTSKSRLIDPTPEELEQRMQEVRAGWSEKEAEAKYCGAKKRNWEIPTFHYDMRTGAFHD
jgi:hypothetical protein